ncbi:MAG: hypothetical protein A2381_03695 [Bdellovibrionales bacterium RIFOXYB1_FULL_37_110]|nr:MAG: hypothetical protein A2417_16290 [Bdellovibrionales bacterium RIFOXYC1_FULL_37_79]OFZ54501.1 MAG: hypothetical protein A2328_07590 [Bdellovibrionales bacterium RIFOXYB2_FULL_36_6]OFZ59139.1 MAG: hypothetical protein A2381_03695 [Bdellovibrionales bacterium RIFOXYB1_FULL_37_110]OFZ64144.1 MAG: hypothetical protein A2577_14725 [Bdellovibrionales bacterium RIFOXYD1_FULL_36_51]
MNKKQFGCLLIFIFLNTPLFSQQDGTTDRGRTVNFLNHKHNFISPLGYVHKLKNGRNDTEFIFQFSIKLPVIGNPEKTVLFAAYTQKSFWQVYSAKESRPFREHNYNPDVFLKSAGKNFNVDLGIEHESNGKSEPNSRAYNRSYLKLNLNTALVKTSLKGWLTLSEEQALAPYYKDMGKERSIDDYYGNFELEITWFMGKVHFYNLARYNHKTKYGAYKGNCSIATNSWIAPFVEYFKGYGDSLIDYNHSIERYTLGIIISR